MTQKEILSNALKDVLSREYGHAYTHEEMAELLCCEKQTQPYYMMYSKLYRLCMEQGKLLESLPKFGYKVAEPDDHLSLAKRQVKQSVKKAKHATSIMKHAPTDRMSPVAREAHQRVSDRYLLLTAKMTEAVTEINKLERQPRSAIELQC